jgi:rubredoxin
MTTPVSKDVKCPQCGEKLNAAASSDRVYPGTVRHRWRCSECGHQFETSPTLAPELVEEFFPNLVIE